MSNETLYLLAPEITLVLFGTLAYLGGAFLPNRRGWSWFAAAGLILAGVELYQQGTSDFVRQAFEHPTVSGPLAVDQFSFAIRFAVLGVGVIFAMLAGRTSEQGESTEFMGSLLLLVSGLMLLAMARDLVLVFVGLELVSIPTYVLLFIARGTGVLESGTKYFFLSILSSAIMLYGFAFLYGTAGSTELDVIRQKLAAAPADSGVLWLARLALVLVFAGLAFRLTAVPFHFYAPDVYQGTSNPNAGILAIAPKIAAIAVLVRITLVAMPGLEQLGWQLALAVAMVTMTLGNLLALWQSNMRRLMAYSSIAHAGYMLIGLAVGFAAAGGALVAGNFDGVGATLFYLLVYTAATAGTFAALTYLSGLRGVNTIDDLAGLSDSHPKTAAAIAVFMFSLTGLPPLAGFWGKFTLFTGALSVDARNPDASALWPWFLALAVVGVINAAISAAYYLRIVGVMYFRPATSTPEAEGGAGAAWATAACAALVIGIGCHPGPLVERAQHASRSVRVAPALVPPPEVQPATHTRRPAEVVSAPAR